MKTQRKHIEKARQENTLKKETLNCHSLVDDIKQMFKVTISNY